MNKKTSIGGQALIEGIIMRGPLKSSTVVRKSDGSLDITEKNLKKTTSIWKKIPFVRGFINLAQSLIEGMEALSYSATVSGSGEEEYSKFEKWLVKKFGSKKIDKMILVMSVFMAVLMSVGLFILIPTVTAGLFTNITASSILVNIIEGIIRIIIFIIYLVLISKMKDIQRTYMYHGAEHKAIFCYERGLDLTVENVRKMPKEHPRCGTSFLFVVMIVSILCFSVFTWTNPILRVLLRLVMIPFVVGVSYEINRLVGKYDNAFTNILRYPGIKLQKLTTIEPDDSMIEVAITALKNVIPNDKECDNW